MTFELSPATPDDLNRSPAFLQTGWWAAFKAGHGWTSLAYLVRWTSGPEGGEFPLSVLLRRLPLGLVLAYVPHGPCGPEGVATPPALGSPAALEALSRALRPHLPRSTVSLRWDLLSGTRMGAETEVDEFPAPLPRPFRKPSADVQPPDTVIVALDGGYEAVLARMHKKTRYNIGLAEKKGVVVTKAGVGEISAWYELYRQTAERDKISIHSERYYRDLFAHAPNLTLWLAHFEGQLLAGNIVLLQGSHAVYLYGASSNEHRNLMAPYALQGAALRDAIDHGATEYDLFGIPPTNDESHPMHGLYRFKTGFGGDRVHRSGAWDWVFRPVAWSLWTSADRLRVWYFKRWKKRR